MKSFKLMRSTWAAICLLVLLAVIAAACGPAPTTQVDNSQETLAAAVAQTLAAQQTFDAAVRQTVTALAPTETLVPAATETSTPTPLLTDTPQPPEASATPKQASGTKITVWVSLTQPEQAVFLAQVADFEQAHPDVRVGVVNVAFGDMEARLSAAFNAGIPPDVAVLTYNAIVDFGAQGLLNAIDRTTIDRFGDYLDDSKLDVMINKVVYAVPWRRQSCAPHYLSFALPVGPNTHPKLGLALANTLNQPVYQTDNYKRLGWYPIRISLYDALNLHCSEVQVVRLAPADLTNAISLANERQKLIQDLLGGAQLNADAATGWVQDGEMQAASEPLKNPVTAAEVKRDFYGSGLVIGGLYVNSSPYVETGNYAVTCSANGEAVLCTLQDPSGAEYSVDPSFFQQLDQPVGQPFTTLELGSFHECWYLDSLKICINIGD
jgi:hypothetical protein